jgi:hypothetical protein
VHTEVTFDNKQRMEINVIQTCAGLLISSAVGQYEVHMKFETSNPEECI